MNKTAIEWANWTWNPITGCRHGCPYCYAKKVAETRLRGRCGYPADEPFRPTFHPNRLDEPRRVRQPSRIFTVSMGDLFGRWVPEDWISSTFASMRAAPQHTFMTLTKNPAGMVGWKFPSNCWAGITAETPAKLRRRKAHLDRVDAPLRFASLEPIQESFEAEDLVGLDWVIVGSESGKGAPPPDRQAVESVITACERVGIPVFVKGNTGLAGPRRWPDEGIVEEA